MPDGGFKIVRKEQSPDARTFAIIPIRAATDRKLTLSQLRVLMVICSYSNKAGFCWTGQRRMAKDLNMSQQAISQQFKKLKANGYVETVFQGFSGERADTIRVIFKEGLNMKEVVKVAGASAPFLAQKEVKKRRGRPPKNQATLSPNSQHNDNSSLVVDSNGVDEVDKLGELKDKVRDKIWNLAMQRTDNSTDYATVLAAINKLLR